MKRGIFSENKCETRHILSVDKKRWEKELPSIEKLELATQVIISVGVGVGTFYAVASSGSQTQGLWALINQYQLYLLLTLMQTNMPSDLQYYLAKFELFWTNFSFLELFDIPVIEEKTFELNYDQEDTTFE
jgi:hypothetical protein